ncbi:hypothetical protein [Sphingorhabdus sp. SMR4y]|uniref:hypothetical protein n=1 Tax=Sphingorhabdus sp. SMR4y TaxID=2584094 RepID=UPI000B5C7408|nr:hypothetical protein [Sphingorhabdus sp. SMR4y]ASK88167.1 hypothetical protein SPHFLASMR4Y_01404 [Sphingorhabdus sp. SMR4y]
MNKLNKALVGTAAAAAMAVSATPAMAKDGRSGGPSAGEVIAGVAIIGAIAAIASSSNKDRRYHDTDYRGDRYGNDRYANNRYRHINERQAVNRCVRAAENGATYRGRASVTDIRDVDRTRYGYRVKGKILVEQNRGRYQRNRYTDKGKFTCYIEGNRVSDVQYSGLKYARR